MTEDVRSVRSDSSSDDGDFHLFFHMLRWHHPHHHHHGHHHGLNGNPQPLPHLNGPPIPLPANPHHHSFLYDLFHHHHHSEQLKHSALPTGDIKPQGAQDAQGDIELGEAKDSEKDKEDPLEHLPHDGVEVHHECTTEHKIFAGVLVTICGIIAIFLFSFN